MKKGPTICAPLRPHHTMPLGEATILDGSVQWGFVSSISDFVWWPYHSQRNLLYHWTAPNRENRGLPEIANFVKMSFIGRQNFINWGADNPTFLRQTKATLWDLAECGQNSGYCCYIHSAFWLFSFQFIGDRTCFLEIGKKFGKCNLGNERPMWVILVKIFCNDMRASFTRMIPTCSSSFLFPIQKKSHWFTWEQTKIY